MRVCTISDPQKLFLEKKKFLILQLRKCGYLIREKTSENHKTEVLHVRHVCVRLPYDAISSRVL
jgi:hypothetical protein